MENDELLAVLRDHEASPDAVGEAARALVARGDKALTKEVKRLLHKRKAAGRETPELEREGEAVFHAPEPAHDEPTAWLSTPDPFGGRVAWFGRGAPGRGLTIVQVVFSDTLGVLEVGDAQVGRKAWRELGERLKAGGPVMAFEVDRAWARELVALAQDRNLTTGRPIDAKAGALLATLGPRPEPAPAPPGRALVPQDAEQKSALASNPAPLFDEPELTAWIPAENALRALAERIDQIQHSPLVLDAAQQLGQREKAITEAAAAYWTAELRRLYATRLYDLAAAFSRSSREAPAMRAAAVAAQLEGDAAVEQVAFCRFLFARSFKNVPPPEDAPKPPQPATPGGRIIVP